MSILMPKLSNVIGSAINSKSGASIADPGNRFLGVKRLYYNDSGCKYIIGVSTYTLDPKTCKKLDGFHVLTSKTRNKYNPKIKRWLKKARQQALSGSDGKKKCYIETLSVGKDISIHGNNEASCKSIAEAEKLMDKRNSAIRKVLNTLKNIIKKLTKSDQQKEIDSFFKKGKKKIQDFGQ